MTLADQTLTRNWQGKDVTGSTIERALARLLRELNPPDDTGQPHPPPRASVLNLVVRAPDRSAEAAAVESLSQLARRHPSRTLVITVDPAAESGLDATVTTHCQVRSTSPGRVCLEEILLTAGGAPAFHLASVVAPLLIADLPVVLWWLGQPPEPGEDLLQLADHVILDSRAFTITGFARFAQPLLLVG